MRSFCFLLLFNGNEWMWRMTMYVKVCVRGARYWVLYYLLFCASVSLNSMSEWASWYVCMFFFLFKIRKKCHFFFFSFLIRLSGVYEQRNYKALQSILFAFLFVFRVVASSLKCWRHKFIDNVHTIHRRSDRERMNMEKEKERFQFVINFHS